MTKSKIKTLKVKSQWVCPSCEKSLIVFVDIKYPPVCTNKDRHSTKDIEMQKVLP